MLDELELRQPENGIAYSLDEAVVIADRTLDIQCLVRPSYVLGGRGMEICSDEICTSVLHANLLLMFQNSRMRRY